MAMARLAAIILAGSSGGVIGAEGARRAVPASPAPASALAAGTTPPPTTGNASAAIKRAQDGMFYADALVNGTPVRFLIDTGASVVVLTPADARRIGLRTAVDSFDDRIETAGGGAAMRWTTLDQVRIGDAQATGVRAAVMRDDLRVSLLGQSALTQLGAITIAGDHLSLR